MAMRGRVSSTIGLSLCAALFAVVGCGRPETAADRQLAEMEKLVTFNAGTSATKEDGKKLRDAASALVKEIGKKG